MKNFKSTKRALLTSVLSMVLCFTMLLGTTFAWFTDSVTSKNNIITAGNLDVELKYAKIDGDKITDWDTVGGKDNIFDKNALWEPGRVEVVYLEVANLGSLELKYQLGVNVANETPGINVAGDEFKLSDHLVFSVVELADKPTTPYTREEAIAAAGATMGLKDYNGKTTALEVDGKDYVALIVYMPTTVGNEANYRGTTVPTIELGINLFATQASAEKDSFGSDYDNDAWVEGFKVTTGADLQTALENGETNIVLEADIELTESLVIPAAATTYSMRSTPVVIDLNGKNITIQAAYDDSNSTASSAVVNYGNVVLQGNGTIKATNNYTVRNYGNMVIDGVTIENGVMNFADLTVESGNISNERSGKHTIYGNGATLTINGGKFHNGNPGNAAIFSYAGEVVINGGEFTIADGTATLGWTSCLLDAQGGAKYTINGGTVNGEIRDYNNNTVVYGGTFTHNSVNKFVAPGFKAVQVDGAWVVSAAIKDAADLQAAIDNAKNGDVIVLTKDIVVTTPAYGQNAINVSKAVSFTIDLNGYTISADTGNSVLRFNIAGSGATSNVTLTLKNGKIVAGANTWCTVMASGIDENTLAVMNLENMTIESSKAGDLAVKAWSNALINANKVTVNATNSAGGFYAVGGEIVLDDCTVNQTGLNTAPYLSVALGVSGGGKITVNSGNYSTTPTAASEGYNQGTSHGSWVACVMNSGGTLVINGGTFSNGNYGEDSLATNPRGLICADTDAHVEINDGTFTSIGAILDMTNNLGNASKNPSALINGGTFSADPRVSGLYASNLISIKEGYVAKENADGTWSIAFDGVVVSTADELTAALTSGKNISLAKNIEYTQGILLADGITLNGNGYKITYTVEDDYHLVKMSTGSKLQNVTLENYRVRTENTTNGTVTLTNVVIDMDNDLTGLDISRGAGVAKLTNVVCKNITDEAHLNPSTQVQVDYTPYGDVLLGGAWALEATDCDFGSLHGWNTRNGSSVSLNNTTTTVFRMHYWSNRTLYIDGAETAWSESGAIPVAHDVGGCWSVQPSFK